MRILWMSNAIWAGTGYGTVTKNIVPRLQAKGHEMAVFAFWGMQGGLMEIEGIKHYPLGFDVWGNDICHQHALNFNADIVITLMDVWVLSPDFGDKKDDSGKQLIKWCPYLPIDHEPAPANIISRLKKSLQPIAMSKFGQESLAQADISAEYAPHGVDTWVLRPMKDRQAEFKKYLGFDEDCFLVGMVANNKGYPCRKSFPEAIEAFSIFASRHPEARLYLHSIATSETRGPNLTTMLSAFGVETKARFPHPYLLHLGFTEEMMCRTYNAMDVLLSPSMGEGFGLPILEAQSCGTPAIVTDFSSMPELCGAGWKVRPSRHWWTPLGSFQVLPDIEDIVDKLEEAYQCDKETKAKEAREFAMQYDYDDIVEQYWTPILKQIEEEL